MRDYSDENEGFGYFLLAIDIMSRFVWCQPMLTPSGEEVEKAFKNIFKDGRFPERIRTDQGTEFSNETVQDFFKSYEIEHFVTQNEVKANYAERAIQTIKGKIMRYIRAKQSLKWVDQLEKFTLSYNNTIHRSIKQTPASVTKMMKIDYGIYYIIQKSFHSLKNLHINLILVILLEFLD